MRHLLLVCGMFAAAVLLLSAPQVRADGIDTFTLNESLNGIDTTTLSWQLPAAGVPDLGLDGAGFAFYNVSTSEYLDGVLQTTIPNDTIVYLVGYGLYDSLQLGVFGSSTLPYSGLESAPVFIPGTYTGTDPIDPTIASTLTISTPEPSVLLMLSIGFLALVGAIALKKIQA
jgi:hypothetical protein